MKRSRCLSDRRSVVREAGALGELPIHLQALALERAWRGDLADARRLIAEAESISTSTGNQVPPFALLRILALQGREAEASPLIEAVIQEGTTRGQGQAVMVAYWAAAVLYNGLGRYEDAAAASRELVTNNIFPLLTMWSLFELIEASARVGDTKVAREALDELAATTQPAGTGFALGIEARCRALLADGDDAEASYREAIKQLDRAGIRIELARAHLLFGEWLRRHGRLREARERLRAAEEMFAEIGMEGFAERARRSWSRPGRSRASARSSRATISRRRRSRSPGSPATGSPTRRSAPSCSSAPARSSGTCTRCSASWGSTRAAASKPPCRGKSRKAHAPSSRLRVLGGGRRLGPRLP